MQNLTISFKVLIITLVAVAFAASAIVLSPSFVRAADLGTPSYSGGNSASYSGGSGYQYSGGKGDTPTYSGGNTTRTSTTRTTTRTPSYSGGNTVTYSGGNGYQYSGGNGYTLGYTTYHVTTGGCGSNCNPPPQYCPSGYTGTYPYCVPPQPAPTCTLSVSPNSITQGQSVVVTWNSQYAVQGSITGIGSNVALSGSYVLYPTQTTTFTGTFKSSDNRTVTCVTSVGVLPPPPQYCPSGYTGTYPNCVPPPSYNYPTCSITISNYNQYNHNQPVTISWNSTNAQYGYINQGFGSVSLSGSRVVYPTQTTTYTGTFTGYNGQTVTCSATVNVNTYVPPVYPTTPYVTLAAVPYTGLELGPIGTAIYWSFLVLWCLIAAYLIVVKRVQDKVYVSLKSILFGSSETRANTSVSAPHVSYTTPVVRNEAKTDDFILSQINRVRA